MRNLGKKSELDKRIVLTPFDLSWINKDSQGRPSKMPWLAAGSDLVCGLDVTIYETLFVCDTLEEMQHYWDAYARGMALAINWYTTPKIRREVGIEVAPDAGIAGKIIEQFVPNAPLEVKQALAAYAMGNLGAARVLAQRATTFTSASEVEELVGWPLSEHTIDRTVEIWDKFNK